MKIAEVGTQKSWIDGPTAAVLFDRIKITCGSTVVCDIQNQSLLAQMMSGIHHSNANESLALRTLRGHGTLAQRQAWGLSDTQEYIFSASPLGTLLTARVYCP